MSLLNPSTSFWNGRRVLLTGHTGFKGAWLSLWLIRLGAKVIGISLPPNTSPSLYDICDIKSIIESHYCDIRDSTTLEKLIHKGKPEIVFHLAAQSLVRTGYNDPLATFATNVQGTANVLDAIRRTNSIRVAVMITTDKVYKNIEKIYPYRETDEIGGRDPYSASKAAAELIITSYRESYLEEDGIALASARAGNVIGGGDWSLDRLIPDAIRAWSKNTALHIRRPNAIRPWQHVIEPLGGYLLLAERLWLKPSLAGAYNFGPETYEMATVKDVALMARESFGAGEIIWGSGEDGPHEAGLLTLEIAKARKELNFSPRWKIDEAIQRSVRWYCNLQSNADPKELCLSEISIYENSNSNT